MSPVGLFGFAIGRLDHPIVFIYHLLKLLIRCVYLYVLVLFVILTLLHARLAVHLVLPIVVFAVGIHAHVEDPLAVAASA